MTVSDQAESETIPDKSRCLRQSSVAKRLETEKARRLPRVKERTSKKYMSKYRRKTENAKERERMKKFNEAFENLRQKLPSKVLVDNTGEKDTKVMLVVLVVMMVVVVVMVLVLLVLVMVRMMMVISDCRILQVSALRSAIHYIKSLQDLLADCDSGNLEEEVYRTSLAMDTAAAAAAVSAAKSLNKSDKVKTKRPARKKKTVKRLSASNDRWTNYSGRFLKQKFETDNTKLGQDNLQAPSTPSSSPSSSPRDVNEISLHISLLDSGNLQQNVDNGQLLYIFQVDDKNISH